MTLSADKITDIFYLIDEFCIEFERTITPYTIGNAPKRKPKMSTSEVITLMVVFHQGGFRDMKHFYLGYVGKHLNVLFPKLVSYNRFVELMQQAVLPMTLFLKSQCMGEPTGIAFIDSTLIRVCNNKRIKRNKVFKGIASTGKSTMGYFHGFKLHLVVNDKGELLSLMITQAHVDDREPLQNQEFIKTLKGKLYGDKGYIPQALTQVLFLDGLHLITSLRNNMKNVLMELKDKILLRKRSVIETINDELKNSCQVEYSRHRSFQNFLTNLISGLIAYSFFDKKPAIKFDPVKSNQLAVF